jgi:3,4-dihydroxy-2-butanone 4-phosphate synthase
MTKLISQSELGRIRARVEAGIVAMQSGLPVVMADDDDRENEADLVAAASTLTHDVMARMIRDCSGRRPPAIADDGDE